MNTELERAEQSVETQSASLKKPLGLWDLVMTQIVFVVGSMWVGTAAKLGQAHLFFWLLAIAMFYIPQAAVVIFLNRLMPLEGGLYQWAKFGFNEFIGFIVAWNQWLLSLTVLAMSGMLITTNTSYALGESGAWMRESKWCIALVSVVLTAALCGTGIRGLSLGKWLHNLGGIVMFAAYGALIVLPFISAARGELKEYHPLVLAAPTVSLFYCLNITSKLAVGGLSGFEYVAVLAGECRSPARNIGRSVLIASPIIALMFILGTSSVLAFIGNNQIDLIGPVPQTLRLGFHSFAIAGSIASVAIMFMTIRSISSMSIHFTGSSRLPMVAGWDNLLPPWFSRLHPRLRTPVNSLLFVGALTVIMAIACQIGAGVQEAFQLIDNAANVFYGTAYFAMFAVPLFGAAFIRKNAPMWLKIAAVAGCITCLLAIFFTVFPIIDVPSPLIFAAKIIGVALAADVAGIVVFLAGRKRAAAASVQPQFSASQFR